MLEAAAVATRLAQYLVLLGLFGAAACDLYAGRNIPQPSARAFRNAAALGLIVVGLGLAVQAGQMSGSIAGATDPSTLWAILTEASLGAPWGARAAALVVVTALFARKTPPRRATAWAAGLSGVALASLAWSGHGAGGEGAAGALRLASTVAHLLAAGLWFGALILFLRGLIGWRRSDLAAMHAGLAGFAGAGSLFVAVLIATGLVNAGFLVGLDPRALFATLWGRLLLIKLALFGVMLALAAHNRFTLTPALSRSLAGGPDQDAALARLRRSLAVETSAAFAVVALVAWLGMLSPTAPA